MECEECEDDLERKTRAIDVPIYGRIWQKWNNDFKIRNGIYANGIKDWVSSYISPAQAIINRVEQYISDNKKLVILESPYAGDVEFNLNYARKCLSDSLARGESPIASHLLYPQVLNDCEPNERKQGIEAGLNWLKVAEKQVFYVDLGWSEGMKEARKTGEELGIEIEERRLYK